MQDKPISKFARADLRYDLSGEICGRCLFSICRGLSDGGGWVWNYWRQSALCEANSLSSPHSSQPPTALGKKSEIWTLKAVNVQSNVLLVHGRGYSWAQILAGQLQVSREQKFLLKHNSPNVTMIFWQQNYFYHWLRYNKLQGGLLKMGKKYCISKVSWEQVLVGTLISLKIGRLLGRAALVLSWAEFWQFLIVVCYHRIACLKASQIFGTNQCKQTALQL